MQDNENIDMNLQQATLSQQQNTESIPEDLKKLSVENQQRTISSQERHPMQEYYKLLDSFSKMASIVLALRWGIFEIIDQMLKEGIEATVAKISLAMGESTNDIHMRSFLDELVCQGYLTRERKGNQANYLNSDYTMKYFMKGNKEMYSDIYHNLFRFNRRLSSMENLMTCEKDINYTKEIYTQEDNSKAYWSYFYKTNERNFENLLSSMNFSKYTTVLDIHGGIGLLGMKIKQKFPTCDVISYENPSMKSCASKFIAENSMSNEINLQFGDILTDTLPQADCIILPHVLLQYSCENKNKIMSNIRNSINSGGEVIIMENLIDEQRQSDTLALKISSMIGILGYEGSGHSFNEYHECLSANWFLSVKLMKSSCEGMCDIIVARK